MGLKSGGITGIAKNTIHEGLAPVAIKFSSNLNLFIFLLNFEEGLSGGVEASSRNSSAVASRSMSSNSLWIASAPIPTSIPEFEENSLYNLSSRNFHS